MISCSDRLFWCLIFSNSYNKVGDGTLANLVPILTGKYVEDIPWNETQKQPFDDVPFIWKHYAARGYVGA